MKGFLTKILTTFAGTHQEALAPYTRFEGHTG